MGKGKEVEMEIDEKIKHLEQLCKRSASILSEYLNNTSVQEMDVEDIGKMADVIKDLSEAKEKMVKACYYKEITKAMSEPESIYGLTYDEMGPLNLSANKYIGMEDKGLYGQNMRRRNGYIGPMMPMQDEINMGGTMFYTEPVGKNNGMSMREVRESGNNMMNTRRNSRYGYSHDEYMTAMDTYRNDNPEHKQKRKEKFNERLSDIAEMITDEMEKMSQEELQMWKSKINKLING